MLYRKIDSFLVPWPMALGDEIEICSLLEIMLFAAGSLSMLFQIESARAASTAEMEIFWSMNIMINLWWVLKKNSQILAKEFCICVEIRRKDILFEIVNVNKIAFMHYTY